MLPCIDIFDTGNAEIDSLHRELVANCGRLLTLVAAGAAWPLIVAETRKLVRIASSISGPRNRCWSASSSRGAGNTLRSTAGWTSESRDLIAQMEQVDGSLKEHWELPALLGPPLIDLMIRHDLDYCSHVQYHQGR